MTTHGAATDDTPKGTTSTANPASAHAAAASVAPVLSSAVTISEVARVAHSRARAKSSITVTLSTSVSVDGGVNTLIDLLPPPRMIRSRAITAASIQIGNPSGSANAVTPPISMPVICIVSSAEANEALRTPRRLRTTPFTSSRVEASTTHTTGRGVSPSPTTMMVLAEFVGRVAVCLAERGGVSEGRIAWHDLVIHTEPEEMGDHLVLRIHDAWRTTTNDSS